jgi:hypothetical protein
MSLLPFLLPLPFAIRLVLWILDNGLIYTLHFFCKYIHIHRNTQTQYKQTCSCTQMFALCGNRSRDLLRSRRVFPPPRHIGRSIYVCKEKNPKKYKIMEFYFLLVSKIGTHFKLLRYSNRAISITKLQSSALAIHYSKNGGYICVQSRTRDTIFV